MKIFYNENTLKLCTGSEQFVAYLSIQNLYSYIAKDTIKELYCSPYSLYYNLTGEDFHGANEQAAFVAALYELRDKGIVDFNKKGRDIIIRLSPQEFKNGEHFGVITDWEVRAILTSRYTARFKLLAFYAQLLTLFLFSKNSFASAETGYRTYCNYSQQHLANEFNLSALTVRANLQKLEDLKLIYIHRIEAAAITETGTIASFSNIYVRYKDRERVQEIENYIVAKNQASNKKGLLAIKRGFSERSIARKLAEIRKGKVYAHDDMEIIYDYVVEHGKTADLSFFSPYDFYKNKRKIT